MANDGGPAFPRPASNDAIPVDHAQAGDYVLFEDAEPGMSLRDWFAGQALAGWMADTNACADMAPVIARNCYRVADAMLEARKR